MNVLENDNEFNILLLVKDLWHRAFIIILCAVVFGVSSFLYTKYLITPLYTAGVKFYVSNSSVSLKSAAVNITSGDLTASKTLVDTYIVILKTRTTLDMVINDADLDISTNELSNKISAQDVNSTEVFEVSVVDSDPQKAALIANTIADVLPDRISDIVANSSVRIVDYAIVPAVKTSPSMAQNTIIGVVLGIILSVAVLSARFLFDMRIKSDDDISKEYNYPVLAIIPDFGVKKKDGYSYYYKKQKE